jgi:hypothetical protein
MDKYRSAAEKKLGDKVHPDIIAQEALEKAEFSSREREYFFNNAYGDLLVDYFVEWLKTAPHETKHREFIYNSALALGDVKSRLIQAEQLGKNIPYMKDMEDNNAFN